MQRHRVIGAHLLSIRFRFHSFRLPVWSIVTNIFLVERASFMRAGALAKASMLSSNFHSISKHDKFHGPPRREFMPTIALRIGLDHRCVICWLQKSYQDKLWKSLGSPISRASAQERKFCSNRHCINICWWFVLQGHGGKISKAAVKRYNKICIRSRLNPWKHYTMFEGCSKDFANLRIREQMFATLGSLCMFFLV